MRWYVNAVKFVVKYPVASVSREIDSKLKQINDEIKSNVADIDKLIKANPDSYLETLITVLDLDQKSSNQILQAMESTIKFDHRSYDATAEPSFLT
ncbi:hypothetical protein G210_3755, partial [Candida maltosa Xu316]